MISSLTSIASLATKNYSEAIQLEPGGITLINDNTLSTMSARFTGNNSHLLNTTTTINTSGNFTIEAWVYIENNTSQDQCIISLGNSTFAAQIYFNYQGNGTFSFFGETNINTLRIHSTVSVYKYTWVHVAATRSGTTIRLFVNGNTPSSATNSTNFVNGTAGIAFGRRNPNTASHYFYGYLSQIRISNSVCYYTSNFTPTITEFTGSDKYWYFDNNNFNSSDGTIIMSTSNVSLTNVGPASVGKMAVNGTSWLSSSSFMGLTQISGALANGAYTIECFFRLNESNVSTVNNPVGIFSIGGNSNGFSVGLDPKLYIKFTTNSIKYSSPENFPGGYGWRHFAITRSPKTNNQSTVRIWIDGTNVIQYIESPTVFLTNSSGILIGKDFNDKYMPNNSQIAKLRIVGLELYTTNFTPNIRSPVAVTGSDWLVLDFSNPTYYLYPSGFVTSQLTNNNNVTQSSAV